MDVLVVGGGFAGIYALHKLRSQGFAAWLLEAKPGFGGVWYANRYPGARCDTPSLQYSYSFSESIQQAWHWPEAYSSQTDILRYLDYVVDECGLRPFIACNKRVITAEFNGTENQWNVETADGERRSTRFIVMATGCLSAALEPQLPGLPDFGGDVLRTSEWPSSGFSVKGKSVALVGTGSSGVQSAPILAQQAARLFILQRTPNYSVPLRNRALDGADPFVLDWKENYGRRRKAALRTPGYELQLGPAALPGRLLSKEQREEALEKRWANGGGLAFMSTFSDMKSDPEVNAQASDFVRRKIRETVADARVAGRLLPDIPLGAKRICADTGYYETFNRPNVELVDLRSEPLVAVTREAIRTSSRDVKVDVIVLAIGFDAVTGAFSTIDIRGSCGRSLAEKWRAGPSAYLGMTVAGFPNLFMVSGPGSPSILTNGVISGEQGVNWISDCLCTLRERGLQRIEATLSAESRWVDHVNAAGAGSLLHAANSYAVGANVPGKWRCILPYSGSAALYGEICATMAADGYRGFSLV
jgi:cyclohexanone monooxygenase